MTNSHVGGQSPGCYCQLWEKKPGFLQQRSVPYGYCGFCMTCSKPGHTRAHPGAVAFTGTWCDRHYRRLALTHPLVPVAFVLWLSVIAVVSWLVWRALL